MTSNLVIKERSSGNQFKCYYLKNQKLFVNILILFWNLQKVLSILNKSESHSLIISKIIGSRKRGYLNTYKVLFQSGYLNTRKVLFQNSFQK